MRLNEQVKNFKLLIRLNELISSSSEFIIHINKEELIFFLQITIWFYIKKK